MRSETGIPGRNGALALWWALLWRSAVLLLASAFVAAPVTRAALSSLDLGSLLRTWPSALWWTLAALLWSLAASPQFFRSSMGKTCLPAVPTEP